MARLLWSLVLVFVMAMASVAEAGNVNPAKRRAMPVPVPASAPSVLGSSHLVCTIAYNDLLPTGTLYTSTSAYSEYADDIHLIAGGVLCDFSFTYFEPTAGPIDIVITIYGNDPADSNLGSIVAGPYVLLDMPGGFNTVSVSPPDAPVIPADVWFSITGVNTFDHGLIVAGGPPTTGVSHDLFLDVPNLQLVFFGGDPVANFNIQMSVDGTVGTEVSTWGKIKSIYED